MMVRQRWRVKQTDRSLPKHSDHSRAWNNGDWFKGRTVDSHVGIGAAIDTCRLQLHCLCRDHLSQSASGGVQESIQACDVQTGGSVRRCIPQLLTCECIATRTLVLHACDDCNGPWWMDDGGAEGANSRIGDYHQAARANQCRTSERPTTKQGGGTAECLRRKAEGCSSGHGGSRSGGDSRLGGLYEGDTGRSGWHTSEVSGV
ncbi:hypothetical protein BS50DRAFT_345948 [Corynespora cassiicola Philippines]|uniref:Uncharacterized protein n=1 Tax=Corynespora cassiicola Philippines TaxID=1448308 RepID=A0A2T2NQA9_CORCC|nr:hypothetical protein BS50DRAFT_345948 [Corynespora cassiicola Philippines]